MRQAQRAPFGFPGYALHHSGCGGTMSARTLIALRHWLKGHGISRTRCRGRRRPGGTGSCCGSPHTSRTRSCAGGRRRKPAGGMETESNVARLSSRPTAARRVPAARSEEGVAGCVIDDEATPSCGPVEKPKDTVVFATPTLFGPTAQLKLLHVQPVEICRQKETRGQVRPCGQGPSSDHTPQPGGGKRDGLAGGGQDVRRPRSFSKV